MAFCTKCGKELDENTKFCTGCGAPVTTQNDFTANTAASVADHTEEYTPEEIKESKAISVLSYFGPLFFVPLVATPNSKFARFHANQGLVLFVIEFLYGIVYSVIDGLLTKIFPLSSYGFSIGYTLIILPFALAWVFLLVITIIGIVNACKGKAKDVPLFGKFRFFK